MSKVEWTKQQLQAIESSGNNILVAAAAGSGKTAVLVERVINKIISKKVNIDQILIVTFTNAAAAEMRERILEAIYKKIDEEPNNVHLQKQINLLSKASICTIDSFCLDVVKNNFYEIDISPNFRIADTAELELIKQETLEKLFDTKYEEQDKEFLKLLDTYTTYSDDNSLKELILNIYSFIQSTPFPNEWLDEQVEKYNLALKLDRDFSNTIWGEIIIKNLKNEILDANKKLAGVEKELSKFEELNKYKNIIANDIDKLNGILKLNKWDDILNYKLKNMIFDKWPVDKKINLEEKEIAKESRNNIKKQIKSATEIIYCNSKQANEDIYYMYNILNSLKKIIFEFDALLKETKKEKNVVDFSDIEHMALKILLKKDEKNKYIPTEAALKYKNKFVEIAIDEYQDSNLVQENILNAISTNKNIFMVGDVKQSIYKFRQARPELFLEKYEGYSNINEEKNEIKKETKIQLFNNFRSRKNILDTTNLIFKNIMSKELGDINYSEKEYLNLGAKYEDVNEYSVAKDTEIFIIEDKEEQEEIEQGEENIEEDNEELIENIEVEAKFVAKKIKEIVASRCKVYDRNEGYRPITYKDIVILLRSTKDKATIFEKELTNLNIPAYSDTSLEYLESIEIQTIMNLLKIIDNPNLDIPLVCVLRSIIGEFTDNELIKIRLETDKNVTFYNAMKQFAKSENKENNKLKEKINRFFKKILLWKQESEYMELDELIWKIYIDTGYYNYVSLMPDGILRQANLKLLFEKAKQYEKASFKGLYNFINFIEKVKNNSGDLSSAKLIGENENVVRIMSIHKSKGLEFPLVFICNCNKSFNMQDLNKPLLLHQDLGIGANYINVNRKIQYSTFAKEALKIKSKEEIISEEMRILYVALTRAKERIIITGMSKNIDKKLKEKRNLLELYSNNEKIDVNILKKYKSYLDWIELVFLKNDKLNILKLQKEDKNKIINTNNTNKVEELKIENICHKSNKKDIEEIKTKLDWQYTYSELCKIESKTSISKIKEEKNFNEKYKNIAKMPIFLRQENNIKLSGAQKGSLVHLCMRYLNEKHEYTLENIEELIQDLKTRNIITDIEAQNINRNNVLNFTKTNIWKELKSAKEIEREKPFYMTINASQIYTNVNDEEKILLQGIIDLYYINEKDELILVDYKTDYIEKEQELIDKYKGQLKLYKEALEQALERNVIRTYIYSTYLNKEILL